MASSCAPGGASKRLAQQDLEMDGLCPAICVPCGVPAGPARWGAAIRRCQPDTLTPIEAMSLIYEWKQKLN